jgi:hypothetical protein
MKKYLLFALTTLLAAPLLAAESDDVKAAAKKLGASSYSWKMTTELPGGAGGGGGGGGGRFRPGPTDGQVDKDGTMVLKMTRGENTTEAVVKGNKGAIKTDDGWRSLSEAAEDDGGGGQNPTRFMARRLQNYKTPSAEAEDILSKTKEVKKSDDAYTGTLTEEGAKQLMSFRRPGADGPSVSDAKGTVKFWVKDGVLSKFQYSVQGTMDFNGNERKMDRTTTYEIKDVGTTKVSVPDDAKKKMS